MSDADVDTAERIVVAGYGPAAHRLVERLAHRGHGGAVTVLGAEPEPAYQRPLLTSVVDGTLPSGALRLPAAPEGVRLLLGVTATAVDRERRLVHSDDGRSHPYDRLVLATGAAPRLPDLPWLHGSDGQLPAGVRVLRTLDDTAALAGAAPVTVVGGGPLAVEAVLALRRLGRDVTLVHRGPYPLDRHLDPRAGELLSARLRALDVDLCLGRTARAYADGKLRLDDGRCVAAHDVLLCTGAAPRDGLARSAGLAVDGGVFVDDELRTDDPRVHAIGDCARPAGPAGSYGGHTTAWEQAETLALLLTGDDFPPARSRPVLRLRARELDLVRLGAPDGADETVVLADAARGRYARLSLRDNRVCGAVLLGLDRAIAAVARLYQRGEPVPADRLALLLGAAPEYAGEELPGDVVVCHCSNVTGTDLEAAWQAGARTPAALTAATRASTGCGSCGDELRRWCTEFVRREEAVSA
ncbi:FAD-dependent oxidoreductase [Streptomyces luteolus]|uniref:FAD-dependent oxidoreductase n=1 Tax=Streptomyces luteolus TaxID=3043615 RepID=A0ABT6T981_9ACTN|nr:FAD-dependent oxidoreductase [Streptomyces sp. B-S-A12]MDI3424250.1 FAD-dependent oxidoreductase [Streptomyces sp. B-S-A12]